MTYAELQEALSKTKDALVVETKRGVRYHLEDKALEVYDDPEEQEKTEGLYVYGYRVYPKLARRRKRIAVGTVKWFFLHNVSLAES